MFEALVLEVKRLRGRGGRRILRRYGRPHDRQEKARTLYLSRRSFCAASPFV
jgi:hypothetical protein